MGIGTSITVSVHMATRYQQKGQGFVKVRDWRRKCTSGWHRKSPENKLVRYAMMKTDKENAEKDIPFCGIYILYFFKDLYRATHVTFI